MYVAIAALLGVAAPWPGRAQSVALVEVALVQLTPMVLEIPLTGTVTARDHASLSSRVSGLVSAVHVTAGDRVDKGALLLSLDPTLEKLGLMEAKADSAEARAILDEARRRWDEARRLGPRKGISESEIRCTHPLPGSSPGVLPKRASG
jgi:multidrug efflux pump subunit AcrA (membrane-fusion protein)